MTDSNAERLAYQLRVRMETYGRNGYERHLRTVWLPQALDADTLATVETLPLDYITGLYPEICVYGPRVARARELLTNTGVRLSTPADAQNFVWELTQTYREDYSRLDEDTVWDRWNTFIRGQHQHQLFTCPQVYNPLFTGTGLLLWPLLDEMNVWDRATSMLQSMFVTELLGAALGRQRFGGFAGLAKRHHRLVERWQLVG